MALRHSASPCGQSLPDGASHWHFRSQLLPGAGLHLPDGASPRSISLRAASSRWRFATAHLPACSVFLMALRHGAASHKALRNGISASNKPHPAEKSTPVWLAIWHIWAGFANSQLQCATFHSTYSYKFTSSLLPTCNRCSDIASLSAHLHRLPTPPPYLRRMRLPPGQGRRCLVLDEACRLTGVQVLYAGYGCSLAGCGVPANHRARESLF